MPDFSELEGDAKKLAQEHPDQVREGEQRVDKELGVSDDPSQSQTQGQQPGQGQSPGQGQP